jgi:glycolate oxidase FAD binding subunit
MNVGSDRLAQELGSLLGSSHISLDSHFLSRYSVDGKQPSLVCFPGEPTQVARVLSLCAEAGAAVAPWGGGTAVAVGNPPGQIDIVIGLHRLNRLVEHDHANLTVTVESGMTLPVVGEILAGQNQFLAFDPPFSERATVGGTVAANINGPRRMFCGSVRDLVIGMKIALITGEQIKAGGKVVKNVAGYDMCKLFVGSLGTLGIITEATLRVSPLPESAATLVASGSLPKVLKSVAALRDSTLLPAAIVVLNSEADYAPGPWNLAVWCEGFSDSVARHLSDAETIAASIGLDFQILRNQTHRQLWSEICDAPLEAKRTIYRVTVPATAVAAALESIEASADASAHVVGDACAGTVWLSTASGPNNSTWLPKLTSLARQHHGHAVMFAAPAAAKENVDVWGPPPPALSLMREIKRQFDPNGLLNPGRFVGGI